MQNCAEMTNEAHTHTHTDTLTHTQITRVSADRLWQRCVPGRTRSLPVTAAHQILGVFCAFGELKKEGGGWVVQLWRVNALICDG